MIYDVRTGLPHAGGGALAEWANDAADVVTLAGGITDASSGW